MKLRRGLRKVGQCKVVLIACLLIMLVELYIETLNRKAHEEDVLSRLSNSIKEGDNINNNGMLPTQFQIEINGKRYTNVHLKDERYDRPSQFKSRIERVNRAKIKAGRLVLSGGRKRALQIFNRQSMIGEEMCLIFEEDRPNWTVKYKFTITKKCLQRKYHPKWVKRIVFANNTEVYRGCRQQEHRCGVAPYFDRKLQKRINTPPCCLKHIIEIFRTFTNLIKKFGGTYFLFGGGLIGWYRNRKIVPYDHDLDVIVAMDFWKTKRFKLFLRELETKHGYHVKWMSWNKIKIYYSKTNHNFIDVWPFSRRGKHEIRIKSRSWKVHNASQVLPLKKSTFEGFLVWLPRDPESILTKEYGNGWRNELTCKKIGKYGNCKT